MTNNLKIKLTPLLLFILTITFVSSGLSQKYIDLETYNVDSILNLLPSRQGKEKVDLLNKLIVSLSLKDYDSGIQYAEEVLNLAKTLDYREGIAVAYRNTGSIYYIRGNYPMALNNSFEALQLYEKLDNKNMVARLYFDIGFTHFAAGSYEKALEYCLISQDKYRERQDGGKTVGTVKDTIRVIGGLGLVYHQMGIIENRVGISRQIVEVMKKNNFGTTEMMLQTFMLGNRYGANGETDSAKKYLNKALAYPEANSNIVALKNRALTHLGYVCYSEGDIDSAIILQKTTLKYYNENGFLFWIVLVSNELGHIYLRNNDLDSSEKYFRQSEQVFNEMLSRNSWNRHDSLKNVVTYGLELYFPLAPNIMKDGMWKNGKRMYFGLYRLYQAKNRTDEALRSYIAFSDAKDTLNKLQRNRETMELQTKYETERKEEQIEQLSQKNVFQEFQLKQSRYFLLGLGGVVLLVIILAVLLIRQNRLRDQQQNLLLQQKLFRSQMNPHFIFNSLTSIQNFIMDAEAHQASKYLSRFSKLIRNILDSSIEEFVPLEEEISTIENYLELQKIRFKNKFDYSIEIDKAINPENVNIPPMLAQPFIENSIEHGIKHKKSKGNIHIRFILLNNRIVLEVEDDGVGRKKAQEILFRQDKDHKSLATAITHERIKVLNKKLKKKITLRILDLKNEDDDSIGTKIVINLPFH